MPAMRPLGYWLKTVDRLIDAQFEAAAADAGLTRRQWQLLNATGHGARTPADLDVALAPFLSGDETSAPDLDVLVRRGLVEHAPDGLGLTAAGRETTQRVQAGAVGQIRERTTGGVSGDDYAHLLTTLEKIARNLGWEDDE
ncbi:MarR family winged helix-turn-helix transcriptional regulator [Antribacter gilvus]|uniref:MarR family winged helix-turn-helix transcriptional regulator n=1 Tax=Antribacter gilvus TaxID=2304675 RepID=UPI000F779402|nr:helix-turn-helix domain-containing protein [Antribacter gilvus]